MRLEVVKEGSRERSVDFIHMSVESSVQERNAQSQLHSGNLKGELCLSIKTKAFSGSLFLFTGIKSKLESMSLIRSLLTTPQAKLKPFTAATLNCWGFLESSALSSF